MYNPTLRPCFLKYILLIYAFLIPVLAHAQYINLSGKVTDAETLKPLANAEVYIANTTIRAKTDANGTYTINKLPTGTYEVLAWCEGYETKSAELVAAENKTVNFALNLRVVALPEVTIRENGDWKQNLARFKREFVGLAQEGIKYKILNDSILHLKYSSKTQTLTAKTDDFLEIVNLTLGYKLRFLIKEFWADYNAGTYHYYGSVIFEELSGIENEQKKWIKSRYNVYDGSFRHFMTALTSNQVKNNGFVIKNLMRTPNPNRPPDSLIMYKITKQFKYVPNNKHNNDSLNKWVGFRSLPKVIESLEKVDVPDTAIIKPGKLPQTYNLAFNGYLYIIYKNITITPRGGLLLFPNPNELYRFKEANNYQIAAISMKTPGEPITFNDKGIKLSKGLIFNEGTWSDSRILELLPFDYIPSK